MREKKNRLKKNTTISTSSIDPGIFNFPAKSFEDILQHFKQCAPEENTRTEITEFEQFLDSVEKCTHFEKNSSQANDNYGILRERMITDLKSESF